MHRVKREQKGFTLLEILLVIAAIGILAAIVLIAINPNRQLAQARNAQRRSDVNTIYKAIEQYLIDTGSYPIGTINGVSTPLNNTYVDLCSSTSPGNTCLNLNALLTPQYLAAIPRDAQASVGITGYRVAINSLNNRVSVQATTVELTQSIAINAFAPNWTPANITTSLWLDASDNSTITQSSGTVSQWNDKSGTNKHATQATSTRRPAITSNAINGLSALDWGETQSDKSIGYSTTGLLVKDVYIVGWFSGASFGNYSALFNPFLDNTFVGITALGGNPYFYNYSSNTAYYFTNYYLNASSTDSNTNVFPTVTSPFILRANATRVDTNDWVSGYAVGMDRNYNTLGRSWTGFIGEIVVSSTDLTLSDRQKLEGYLAHKWGLISALPITHPYKVVAPTQ